MNQQNYDKLKALKLSGMADSYETLFMNPSFKDMGFDELLGLMLDHEEIVRKSNKGNRRLYPGRQEHCAQRRIRCWENLAGHCLWRAGMQACRQHYRDKYTRLPDLLEAFKVAKYQADDSYAKLLKALTKVDLLILDEWLLFELSKEEAALLLEIVNSRYTGKKSNVFCSQFEIKGWYEKLGDGTLAEAILDRIIHNSYDVFIDGTVSMREKMGLRH